MDKNYNCFVYVNLHETQYLEETLQVFTEFYARETVVFNADSIHSRHNSYMPSVSRLLDIIKESNCSNKMITALIDSDDQEMFSEKLQTVKNDKKYAASFWFVPVSGYFYHKTAV